MTYPEYRQEHYSILGSKLNFHFTWIAIDLLREDFNEQKKQRKEKRTQKT